MSAPDLDSSLMGHAIDLARHGDPSPNPRVGSLIADGTNVIAEAYHAAAGLDHAEIAALKIAGDAARGKTLYVTLEPCNHEGRTPPCVDAILAAGIRRVVIGTRDPNPRVAGGGLERLRNEGVEVVEGVLEARAKELIKPWAKFITHGTSYLTLKLALSLDGRIATRSGASKWITWPESRLRVQALRAAHDAVMIGINTVLADNPRLTVRDVPGRSPTRADRRQQAAPAAHQPARANRLPGADRGRHHGAGPAREPRSARSRRRAHPHVPATAEGRCDTVALLRELATRDVVSVLCEGGAELAGSLLAHRSVDELHAFVAPRLLGPRGRPGAVDWAGPDNPADAPHIDTPRWELCGTDAYVWGPMVYPRRTGRTSPGV